MARSTKGLYKRGPVWWMTYRDALGQQRWESCKTPNKGEAEKRLIERRKEAMEGLLPAAPIKPLSLEELEARYLAFANHQRGVKTKRFHFAHFKRLLGNPPIHTLTVDVLDRYRDTRRAEGVQLSTINREMATLKHAMTKAVEWKLVRKTVREELLGVKKFAEPGGRLRYLSGPEEADRLLKECRGLLHPIVTMALHTGMRKSEILTLTWDMTDLRNGFIRLKHTKNGQPRTIPINDTVHQLLAGRRSRLDVNWVFHDEDGRRLPDIRKPFEAACKRAGLMDFHFHDLRHTFASWLVMNSVPLATVSDLLGHRSPTMTMRYAHLSPRHKAEAVRVLDGQNPSSLDNHMTNDGFAAGQEQVG
jgi:integrase